MPTAWSISSSFVAGRRRDAALPGRRRPRRGRRRNRCAARAPPARPVPRERALVGIAALGPDPALVRLQRGAVGDRLLGAARPSSSSTPRSESASSRAQAARTSSGKSGGPSPRTVAIASRISSALPTARPSGWSMSVSRHTTSRLGAPAEIEHRLGERPGVLDRLHERAVADLGVEHDRLGSARDLLRHDARGDQRVVVDGRGHVAQRVELLVGRNEVRALRR